MKSIIIAAVKSWNIDLASKFMRENRDRYNIILVSDNDSFIEQAAGKEGWWMFFPHWNWIVSESVWSKNHCVAFHIGDLPNGKGGSPVQNHILKKIYDTQITAFRMNGGVDSGPVYMKRPISLRGGSVEDILKHASSIIFEEMIPYILRTETVAVPQVGEGNLKFRRRTPEESNLNLCSEEIPSIYDFIRMLDGEGYPRAFLKFGLRFQSRKVLFSDARLIDGKVKGTFEIE